MRQISGLGNQLFQYAAGQYYARHYKASMEMVIDPPAQAQSYGFPRPFLLANFCVEQPLRQVNAMDRALFAHRSGLKQLGGLLRKTLSVEQFTEPVAQRYTFIKDLPLSPGLRTLYLSGYWQAAAFVEAVEDKLRAEFQLRERATGRNLEVLDAIVQCAAPISLHIRRGDYKIAPGPKPLSMDFYSQAISIVREKCPNPTFFVFSDEMQFARENLPPDLKAVFVDHNDSFSSHEDLRLMSACHHHIIANSSFSWWGAWMNASTTKLVVAPRNWLGTPGSFYPELFPAEWITID